MKTNVKKFIVFFTASLIAAFAFADQAEVVSIKGKVEVNRNNAWVTLNVGDKINESEEISTGFQSEAKIKYKDSVMHMGSLSRVTLSKLSADSKKDVVDVYLSTGAVRSKVNRTSDKKVSYTVRSAVAVASVRGTDFISCANGTNRCLSGAIAVSPARYYEDARLDAESAEEIEEPAEGESTAATAPTDVDPYAADGATLLVQGQETTITPSGNTSSAFTNAVKASKKAEGAVGAASKAEAESVAPSSSSNTGTSTPVTPAPAPTKGSIIITPVFE